MQAGGTDHPVFRYEFYAFTDTAGQKVCLEEDIRFLGRMLAGVSLGYFVGLFLVGPVPDIHICRCDFSRECA